MAEDFARMAQLAEQYDDLPLGTTAGPAMELAERLGITEVATLDQPSLRHSSTQPHRILDRRAAGHAMKPAPHLPHETHGRRPKVGERPSGRLVRGWSEVGSTPLSRTSRGVPMFI